MNEDILKHWAIRKFTSYFEFIKYMYSQSYCNPQMTTLLHLASMIFSNFQIEFEFTFISLQIDTIFFHIQQLETLKSPKLFT